MRGVQRLDRCAGFGVDRGPRRSVATPGARSSALARQDHRRGGAARSFGVAGEHRRSERRGALARLAEHEASANEARLDAAGASRCNAFIIAMRGTIRSLPCSPTSISNSIAGFFAAVALGTSLNLFLRIAAGTIAGFPRESLELGQWHRECAMRGKQIKFQSDSVMVNVNLGASTEKTALPSRKIG